MPLATTRPAAPLRPRASHKPPPLCDCACHLHARSRQDVHIGPAAKGVPIAAEYIGWVLTPCCTLSQCGADSFFQILYLKQVRSVGMRHIDARAACACAHSTRNFIGCPYQHRTAVRYMLNAVLGGLCAAPHS